MVNPKKKNKHATESKNESVKKHYTKPMLKQLGSVHTLTLGSGGSSIDGNHSNTQTGKGNDGTGPHIPS